MILGRNVCDIVDVTSPKITKNKKILMVIWWAAKLTAPDVEHA